MPHPVLLSQMIPYVTHSLVFGIETIFTKISDKVGSPLFLILLAITRVFASLSVFLQFQLYQSGRLWRDYLIT